MLMEQRDPKSRTAHATGTNNVVVATVFRTGGHFTAEWVYALAASVADNCPNADFICLSDDPTIKNRIPLTGILPGWWSKIELFQPILFEGARVLYLDLDTVITGDLTHFANTGQLLVLSDLYTPKNMASGVLSWIGGDVRLRGIYDRFMADPVGIMKRHPRRMDHYLRQFLNQSTRLQDVFPGQILSYKADLRGRIPPYKKIVIPPKARLICMHGRPTITDLPPDDPVRKASRL